MIERLDVGNYGERAHTASVLLLEDQEVVYWDVKEATAAEGDTLGGAVFEDFPTEPGRYTLKARAESQAPGEWASLELGTMHDDCVDVLILLEPRAGGSVVITTAAC